MGLAVSCRFTRGPQRLSRAGDVPLQRGMILSNEPGYYRPDAFGIRIENLITVIEAEPLPGGDDRAMLAFETLTYAPIDLRLIEASELTKSEKNWLNAYQSRGLCKTRASAGATNSSMVGTGHA